jgi:hypothetical protein
MTLRRTAALLAVPAMVVASLTLITPAAQAAVPANDDVASAQTISGSLPITGVAGDTTGATAESGETMGDGYDAGNSIWYAWTPASSGPVEVSLAGSGFDTFLTVYTGSSPSLADLSVVTYNDDGATDTTSVVDFSGAAGTTYYFQVDGCCGTPPHESGRVDLSISAVTTGITGVVTKIGGAAAAGVCVSANGNNGSSYGVTNATGAYLLGTPAGSYTVSFRDCDGGANVLDADYDGMVAVTEGALAHADITLGTGAIIRGTVTGPGGSTPADVCVYADSGDYWSFTETTTGDYRLEGLPAGAYKIEFDDCYDGTLATAYYGGATRSDQATPVTVAAGATVTGKNVQMVAGASISGTISNASGARLDNACAEVYNDGYDVLGYVDENGRYEVRGLPVGTYRVMFRDDCDANHSSTLWYGGSTTEAGAKTLTLEVGQQVTGINAVFGQPAATGPSAACIGAQASAHMATIVLGNATSKLHSDQGKLKQLGKKVKKAKGHAKSKLVKKQKKLKKTVNADKHTVSTATTGAASANAAVSAACR